MRRLRDTAAIRAGEELSPTYPAALLAQVVACIAPFFDDSARQDDPVARDIARHTLEGYAPVTGKELQLAAQDAAFGMAALTCLSCAVTARDLTDASVLRMQRDALKLNEMANKAGKALLARQRERDSGKTVNGLATRLDHVEFIALLTKARGMVAFARATVETHRVAKGLARVTAPKDRPAAVVPPPPAIANATKLRQIAFAEPMTPEVLTRRRTADQLWAEGYGKLPRPPGRTSH